MSEQTSVRICGFPVVLDERMSHSKVAVVNERGHGVSLENGEVVPCIVPAPPPPVSLCLEPAHD